METPIDTPVQSDEIGEKLVVINKYDARDPLCTTQPQIGETKLCKKNIYIYIYVFNGSQTTTEETEGGEANMGCHAPRLGALQQIRQKYKTYLGIGVGVELNPKQD